MTTPEERFEQWYKAEWADDYPIGCTLYVACKQTYLAAHAEGYADATEDAARAAEEESRRYKPGSWDQQACLRVAKATRGEVI